MLTSRVWLPAAELNHVIGNISIITESPRLCSRRAELWVRPPLSRQPWVLSPTPRSPLGCSGVPGERVSDGRAHCVRQCCVNPSLVTLGSHPVLLGGRPYLHLCELQSSAQEQRGGRSVDGNRHTGARLPPCAHQLGDSFGPQCPPLNTAQRPCLADVPAAARLSSEQSRCMCALDTPKQRFSKCGPWASSSRVTCILARNAVFLGAQEYWGGAHPQG